MDTILGMSTAAIAEKLQQWLQENLAHTKNLNVKHVSLPENGASNLTGIIDTAWTEGGRERRERLILRTVSPSGNQLYETYDLSKQYHIMECLAETPIKVPRLLGYESNKAVLGQEFYVMYNTGGRAAAENPPYHVTGWFKELTNDQRRKVWMQAIDTIAQVHRLDWQGLGMDFVAIQAPQGSVNERFVARHSGHLRWMERRNGRSNPRLRRVFDWLEANFPQATPTTLLWADAKLGNLMIEGDEIVGVLDWEHCTIGPSLYDLANFMIFDEILSTGPGLTRLPGLPTMDETVKRYEVATGRPVSDIQYFRLFSAVRLTNVICGMAPGLIAAGRMPADFEERNPGIAVLNEQLNAMGLAL